MDCENEVDYLLIVFVVMFFECLFDYFMVSFDDGSHFVEDNHEF